MRARAHGLALTNADLSTVTAESPTRQRQGPTGHLIQHDGCPTKLPLMEELPLWEKKEGNGFSGLSAHPSERWASENTRNSLLRVDLGPRDHSGGGGRLFSRSATKMWGENR